MIMGEYCSQRCTDSISHLYILSKSGLYLSWHRPAQLNLPPVNKSIIALLNGNYNSPRCRGWRGVSERYQGFHHLLPWQWWWSLESGLPECSLTYANEVLLVWLCELHKTGRQWVADQNSPMSSAREGGSRDQGLNGTFQMLKVELLKPVLLQEQFCCAAGYQLQEHYGDSEVTVCQIKYHSKYYRVGYWLRTFLNMVQCEVCEWGEDMLLWEFWTVLNYDFTTLPLWTLYYVWKMLIFVI